MKKVVVSLLVIMMAISFTGIAAAQTTCPATTATTCATACPATTCAQSTSCATSSCTSACPTTTCATTVACPTACPTKCPTPCPTVCPTVVTCPAVVCCVATTSCCPVTVACPVVKETPKTEAKEAAAKAKEGGQAATQSSVGSTKSPQVTNNNKWTQTQTYAPVNTFNIYKNTLTGPTSTETISTDDAVGALLPASDGGSHVDVNVQGGVFWIDQNAKFDDQTMVNPTEIKNVEITKDITKTVDIDKTITIGSYNEGPSDLHGVPGYE